MLEREERHDLGTGLLRILMLEEMNLLQVLQQVMRKNLENVKKIEGNNRLVVLLLAQIPNHQIIYIQDQIFHQLHQNLADPGTRNYPTKSQCSSMYQCN
jgi:hypothetical protein